MPTRALTVAAVARIKPPQQGQADYFDQGYPGLALRVSYGGAKSWIYFYRLRGGKLRRLTIGRYPGMDLAAARTAWQAARLAVGKGESPANLRPASADSFAAVADEWLKRDQAHNRTHREVKRIIERDVKPVWRDRLFATINRRDVVELLDLIGDRAPTMARRTHSYLHRLFRWSVGRGIIELNPIADLPKPGSEVRRDRVLTDVELVSIWKAAAKIGFPFGQPIQLLMLTAARRDEICSLRWHEIHGQHIVLEGRRTKNGEKHTIPLSATAAKILESLPHIADSPFVFTTTGKAPASGWSKAKLTFDAAIKGATGTTLAPWRFHDIRRTVATGLQRIGTTLQVIEAVLGHIAGSRAGVVGIYQRHSFDTEKRIALNAWALELERIVAGKTANIVPMRRTARQRVRRN